MYLLSAPSNWSQNGKTVQLYISCVLDVSAKHHLYIRSPTWISLASRFGETMFRYPNGQNYNTAPVPFQCRHTFRRIITSGSFCNTTPSMPTSQRRKGAHFWRQWSYSPSIRWCQGCHPFKPEGTRKVYGEDAVEEKWREQVSLQGEGGYVHGEKFVSKKGAKKIPTKLLAFLFDYWLTGAKTTPSKVGILVPKFS